MADQPLRAPPTNGASTLMETLVANSDESSSNSDESTQKMQKEIEQPKSIPLIKSFAEAVANSAGNRSLHQHPFDLRKFFLADHNPQPLGIKSVNQGQPTLSFANVETEELAAPYLFSLVRKFSHGAPPYSQMHQLMARLGTQGVFTEALFSIASMVGTPLQIDALTLNESKLSQARVCVEIDLLKPIIEEFDLHINGVTIVQKVIFEHLPEYCSLCKHVGHKDSDCFPKVERSIADQPKKGKKDQQENDNQVEQIQSHGKQGNLKMDITGTPNSETYQGAAIHGCSSHSNLTPQGDNYTDNMDNFNLDDPLIAELLDRDGNAENHDLSSTSKPKTRGKAKKTPKSGDKGCTFTKATGTRILLRGECSNQKQRNKFLSDMDIIEIQATQETSESEAQDTKESSDKEEAVTPTYNRFQSLDDSDSLLELDTELQPQVQASEQEIYRNANDIALEYNLQEHILEDSTMSNKLKRNNSMEHNPLKTGIPGELCGKSVKDCPSTRYLGLLEEISTLCFIPMKTKEAPSVAWALLRNLMIWLQQKLYRLKDHLKQWNKDNFSNIFSLVDQAKAAANEVEKQFDRLPSEANLINLNRQNAALVHALNLESEFWRQKSNSKWLEAGERNTKFFHASVKKKRLKSRISTVMDNQQEITDSAQIKDSAVHFFGSLLSDFPTTSLPHDFPFQFP
ncbi:UNVERIFIED_CONTAM: hypothetical protein Sindi_0103200 [Sesamum indicum]